MMKITTFVAATLFSILFSVGTLADVPKMVQVTGKFVQVAAIGGETTGTAIQTSDGQYVEIAIGPENSLVREQIHEGDTVQAEGYFVTVLGIDIPTRQVLTVVSLKKVD